MEVPPAPRSLTPIARLARDACVEWRPDLHHRGVPRPSPPRSGGCVGGHDLFSIPTCTRQFASATPVTPKSTAGIGLVDSSSVKCFEFIREPRILHQVSECPTNDARRSDVPATP